MARELKASGMATGPPCAQEAVPNSFEVTQSELHTTAVNRAAAFHNGNHCAVMRYDTAVRLPIAYQTDVLSVDLRARAPLTFMEFS